MWQWASAMKLLRLYRQLLEIDSPTPLLWHHLSDAFLAKNDFDGALRTLAQQLSRNFLLCISSGLVLVRSTIVKGNYDAAIRAFKTSWRCETTIPLQLGLLGEVLWTKKDFEEAITIFREGNRKVPASGSVLGRCWQGILHKRRLRSEPFKSS